MSRGRLQITNKVVDALRDVALDWSASPVTSRELYDYMVRADKISADYVSFVTFQHAVIQPDCGWKRSNKGRMWNVPSWVAEPPPAMSLEQRLASLEQRVADLEAKWRS